jgi:hypothetical protein
MFFIILGFTETVFGILLQSDGRRVESKPKLLIELGFEYVTRWTALNCSKKENEIKVFWCLEAQDSVFD